MARKLGHLPLLVDHAVTTPSNTFLARPSFCIGHRTSSSPSRTPPRYTDPSCATPDTHFWENLVAVPHNASNLSRNIIT